MNNITGKSLFLAALFVFSSFQQINAQTVRSSDEPRSVVPSASSRISYTINDNWRFSISDNTGSEKRSVSDAFWEPVNLPHTWNAEDAFDDVPDYRRGGSWYRRELRLDPAMKDKRIFLFFEGANQVADVYVNEKLVGRHVGGYTAFSFDVTDFIKYDEPNLLAVRVDNSFNADIPPLTADFTFYGGIYRDVWLIATENVHLKTTDYASSGVQITTPQVSEASGTVNVRGTIMNDGAAAKNVEVVNSIMDDGKEISSTVSKLQIKPKSEGAFEQASKPIAKPKLWSPDSPNLYQVKTVVRENGKVTDEITNPLGFRWFTYDGEKGFTLNGKPLMLRGANRHQDYAGMGNAVPDSIHVRDMELMKEAGYNFVRLAHYPQDPSVLQAADRLGILLWEETPLVNYITISDGFTQNSKTMLTEMIRQHRNHPSVLMWGYMNEIYLRVPKENEAGIKKATVALAKELDKLAHQEDATRPTTIAFHGSDVYNTEGLGDIPNIIGWNLYSGWYSKVFEDFGKYIDDQHQRYPKRPLIISEYGANGDTRLHSNEPRRFDSTTEYQRMFHESYLEQIKARPYIIGTAIWNEFDFGAELRGETIPHVNQKGMFTYARQPKDVHFFYKANYSAEPMIHIAATDWVYRAETNMAAQKIDVYSNLAEVELFNNGVSLGKKKLSPMHKATWDVSFRDGENTLVANGASGSSTLTDAAKVYYKLVSINSNEIAVNLGSNAQFIDESKTVWLADQAYTKGSWGYIGADAKLNYSGTTDKNVLGTLDDPLFQTTNEGLTGYRFDVPAGEYEVELRFVETKMEKGGERIFDVKINGQTVLDKLDLTKEFGFQRASTKIFRATVTDGITIDFTAYKAKPIISAIRIKRL